MGNYKFKLSDMMPNAWFYKLRDMSKTTNTHPIRKKHLPSQKRPSLSHRDQQQPRHAAYYHHCPETETETAIDKFCTSPSFNNTHDRPKLNSKRKSIHKPSSSTAPVSTLCNCRAVMRDNKPRPTPVPYTPDHEFYGSHRCRITASSTDIIIDVDGKSFSRKIDKLGSTIPEPEPEPEPELELPPILTKPIKPKVVIGSILEQGRNDETMKTKKKRKKQDRIPGIKLRANSPRIASKKTNQILEGGGRRSGKKQNLSAESFAIVKSSFDPQTDFKDSMVEMIIENNIRESKDLEELLAVYLSLNSDEYHGLIVKAFEQIWFDMADLRL